MVGWLVGCVEVLVIMSVVVVVEKRLFLMLVLEVVAVFHIIVLFISWWRS